MGGYLIGLSDVNSHPPLILRAQRHRSLIQAHRSEWNRRCTSCDRSHLHRSASVGDFFRDAAATDDAVNRNSVFTEAFHDDAGAEGCPFDQRAVNIGACGVERLAEDETAEPRIDENCAVAVVPIECDEPALSGFLLGCFLREFGVQTRVSLANDVDPPIENISYGGLARFDTVTAG